jgi:hypothetical protein
MLHQVPAERVEEVGRIVRRYGENGSVVILFVGKSCGCGISKVTIFILS